jgi:hypothetical protein
MFSMLLIKYKKFLLILAEGKYIYCSYKKRTTLFCCRLVWVQPFTPTSADTKARASSLSLLFLLSAEFAYMYSLAVGGGGGLGFDPKTTKTKKSRQFLHLNLK